jgi:anti-sigma regulatory factor (Ser/Thr protein kinase)
VKSNGSERPREVVELSIPSNTEFVTLARYAAATVAARADFDLETIEDLRLAVDELCAAVGAFGQDSSIRIELVRHGGVVRVTCWSESNGGGPSPSVDGDWQPGELAVQLLGALADRHGFEHRHDRPCGWLEIERDPAAR